MQAREDDEADIAHFSSPEKPLQRSWGVSAHSGRDICGISQPHGQTSRVSRTTISTGLPQLDAALASPSLVLQSPFKPSNVLKHRLLDARNIVSSPGGLRRGEVAEITGPRGIGKTLVAMEAAASVLSAGEEVVWIDTAGPMLVRRFKDILLKYNRTTSDDGEVPGIGVEDFAMERMHHFQVSTLSHLLALLSLPPAGFPPPKTGLIVVDSISSLFRAEFRTKLRRPFSKHTSNADLEADEGVKNTSKHTGLDPQEEKLRWKVIGDILSSLKKFANIYHCAVIVTNELATRFRSGQKPMLHETLTGTTWDVGVGTKIVLYWIWLPEEARDGIASRAQAVRVAEVLRVGKVSSSRMREEKVIPYIIEKAGINSIAADGRQVVSPIGARNQQSFVLTGSKRKLDDEDSNIDAPMDTQSSRLMTSENLPFDAPTTDQTSHLFSDGLTIGEATVAGKTPLNGLASHHGNPDSGEHTYGGMSSVTDNDIPGTSASEPPAPIDMTRVGHDTHEQQ